MPVRAGSKLPSSLLIGTDLTFVPYQEQLGLCEDFIVNLETFMGVSHTDVNMT
jgi:hypothetical protein